MTTFPEIHRPAPAARTEGERAAGTGAREHLHFDRRTRVWWQHSDAAEPMRPTFEGRARVVNAAA